MPLAKTYDFKVQMYVNPPLLALYETMKKKKFRILINLTDYKVNVTTNYAKAIDFRIMIYKVLQTILQ